jgi:hypothetical protein
MRISPSSVKPLAVKPHVFAHRVPGMMGQADVEAISNLTRAAMAALKLHGGHQRDL